MSTSSPIRWGLSCRAAAPACEGPARTIRWTGVSLPVSLEAMAEAVEDEAGARVRLKKPSRPSKKPR